jgi:hypothetical protein
LILDNTTSVNLINFQNYWIVFHSSALFHTPGMKFPIVLKAKKSLTQSQCLISKNKYPPGRQSPNLGSEGRHSKSRKHDFAKKDFGKRVRGRTSKVVFGKKRKQWREKATVREQADKLWC